MLIDIPVFIAFNAEARHAQLREREGVFGRTLTMRFDPENTDLKAQYAWTYPPKPDTKFWTDEGGVLFDLLPSNATDKRFVELANQDPESYFVDQEAAKRAVGETV